MGEAIERLRVKLTRVVVPPGVRRIGGKLIHHEGYTYDRKTGQLQMFDAPTGNQAPRIGPTGRPIPKESNPLAPGSKVSSTKFLRNVEQGSRCSNPLAPGSKVSPTKFMQNVDQAQSGDRHRPLHEIADDISKNWRNVSFGAAPYLDAMRQLGDIDSNYYADSARSIVGYFLSNAGQFKGPEAKRIKAELRKIQNLPRKPRG